MVDLLADGDRQMETVSVGHLQLLLSGDQRGEQVLQLPCYVRQGGGDMDGPLERLQLEHGRQVQHQRH